MRTGSGEFKGPWLSTVSSAASVLDKLIPVNSCVATQLCETRVRAQRIESRIHFEENNVRFAALDSLLQRRLNIRLLTDAFSTCLGSSDHRPFGCI